MAEGDATVLNNFKENLLLGDVHCDSDTFKIALYDTALDTPDGAAPAYSDTNEISGTGYTAGGATVSSPAVTQDDGNDWAKWDDDGSDITWSSLATNTIAEARLWDDTHAADIICILWEIATNSNGGDYTLQFGANGIMTLA